MIPIVSILADPELGGTSFTVLRTTRTFDRGGAVQSQESEIKAVGCIHPATPEELQQLPEENRVDEYIIIYTCMRLSLGSNERTTYLAPDRIRWNGKLWQVVKIKDWSPQGFIQALAILIPEEG